MAWALKFLGTTDNYAELTTPISELGGGDWVVEFTFQSFRTISDNCPCISGDVISDMLGYHYNSGTQSVGWRKDGTWEYFGSGIDPITSAITIKAERIGSTTSVYVDGVPLGTSTRVNYGDIEFIGGAIRGASQTNFPAAQEVQFLKIQSPTIDVYLDADVSDHSNTGLQPVWEDTVGSNDATGLNFPTDGSAWVDLGGSGVDGTVAIAMSSFTSAGSGIIGEAVTGAVSELMSDLLINGSGVVGDNPTGTVNTTMGDISLSAAGNIGEAVAGAVLIVMSDIDLTSSGNIGEAVNGSVSAQADDFVIYGEGTFALAVTGTANIQMEDFVIHGRESQEGGIYGAISAIPIEAEEINAIPIEVITK